MKPKTKGIDPDLLRHLFVGAGLGVYLGFAYRHPSEPNASLVTIVGLSVFITIVIGLFHLYQKGRSSYIEILKGLPLIFAKMFVIMLLLAARFYIWEYGGKLLTTFYTTALGVGAGALIYWQGSGKSPLI